MAIAKGACAPGFDSERASGWVPQSRHAGCSAWQVLPCRRGARDGDRFSLGFAMCPQDSRDREQLLAHANVAL